MKTRKNDLMRMTAAAITLFFAATLSLAAGSGGGGEVFLSGSTNTSSGEFVVTSTDKVYHYMGDTYEVYTVEYDNQQSVLHVAVKNGSDCDSFIMYNDHYWFLYECTRDGFGLRRVMFASKKAKDNFELDGHEFHKQSIMVGDTQIEKEEAVRLIAVHFPKLSG
ncbi:MAG: hypothetical protein ACQERV_14190 [Bacteroidota bacterium]